MGRRRELPSQVSPSSGTGISRPDKLMADQASHVLLLTAARSIIELIITIKHTSN